MLYSAPLHGRLRWMATKIISKEEAIELKRLYREHVIAVNRAGVILVSILRS
jgi:hypothetical protein